MNSFNKLPVEYILSVHFGNLDLYCKERGQGLSEVLHRYRNGFFTIIDLALDNLKATYPREFEMFTGKNYVRKIGA